MDFQNRVRKQWGIVFTRTRWVEKTEWTKGVESEVNQQAPLPAITAFGV
jgi:hypothetical protein